MPEVEAREDIALTAEELTEVRSILAAHVPACQVWAFGSRVTGGLKPFSDLDLAVESGDPLSLAKQAELGEAFQESDLPFRVDIVDLAVTEPDFAARVKRTGVLL